MSHVSLIAEKISHLLFIPFPRVFTCLNGDQRLDLGPVHLGAEILKTPRAHFLKDSQLTAIGFVHDALARAALIQSFLALRDLYEHKKTRKNGGEGYASTAQCYLSRSSFSPWMWLALKYRGLLASKKLGQNSCQN